MPAACAFVLAMILVVPVTRKVVAGVEPNVTDVAPFRPVPMMVTVVPPEVGPPVGVNEVIVGGAVVETKTKLPVDVAVP